MADIKFSEFPKANQSKDSDEIAILQDGVNKMIPSPVLESKIINKTVSRVIQQGRASLNVVNLKGVVPTYADLALITPTPEINDAYQVEADGLVYVYTESGFQSDGDGFVVQPKPTGVVEEGNTEPVSGNEVYLNTENINTVRNYILARSKQSTKISKYIKNIWIKGRKNQDISNLEFRVNYFSYKTYFPSGLSIQIARKNGSQWIEMADFNFNVNETNWVDGKVLKNRGAYADSYYHLYIELGEMPTAPIALIDTINNTFLLKKSASNSYWKTDLLTFDSGKFATIGKNQMYANVQEALNDINYDDFDNRVTLIIFPGTYPFFNTHTVHNRKRYFNFIGINKEECVIKDTTGNYYNSPAQMWFDGVCENLSFIATHSTEVTPSIGVKSYALHMDYGANNNAKFKNCYFYSEQASAIGIGTFQDDYIEFKNCDFISNIQQDYFPYAYLPHYGGVFIHSAVGSTVTNQNVVFKNCYSKGSGDYAAFLTSISEQWDFSKHIYATLINNTFVNGSNDADLRMEFNLNKDSHGNNNSNLNIISNSTIL